MKLRLTESDLHRLISTAVNHILRENIENNSMLSSIVQSLSTMDINASPGENEIEVPLNEYGDTIANIVYYVYDRRYIVHGSSSYDEVNIDGDYSVQVMSIEISDEDGEVTQIDDNGMVADALNNMIVVSNYDLSYPEKEYDEI